MLKGSQIRWLLIAGFLVMLFEFLTFYGYEFPDAIVIPVIITLILLIGHETLFNGLKALFSFNFANINLLMFIACAGAIALGQYIEAAVVIVLFNLAERLEDLGIARSQSAIGRLLDNMPKLAAIKGSEAPIEISKVIPGQILILKPGEMVGLDGVVNQGSSLVDESMITGEPMPNDKRVGDPVFAGSMNLQGYLEVEVTRSAKESALSKIQELTLQSLQAKAPSQQFIEKFSNIYTPSILFLAIGWTIGGYFAGYSFPTNFSQALSLLVIGCPCALVISTPISIFSAIGNASLNGVLIKGGRYLEALGRIKAIAFDKTRTLTFGEPVVTDIIPCGQNSKAFILSCAAGIEALSDHPLAKSIVEAAKLENAIPHTVKNFNSLIGKGVTADCLVCDDQPHFLGKLDYILENNHIPEELIRDIESLQDQGKTVVIISNHRELEGYFALEDSIRPNSQPLIAYLKRIGIHTVLLTGDHLKSGLNVANQVGITEVKADMLPADKAQYIKDLSSQYGCIAMVGDGINDAPALASADVGISMSSLGSDIALEAATIIVLKDHLDALPYLIKLGKKTLNIIQFNTLLAILVKLLVIGLALANMTNLAMAIFADVGITLMVILNSLRLMNRPTL